MAQFDVHRNPEQEREDIPYVIDIQSDLLSDLPTRLVAPLIRTSAFGPPVGRLHPRFVASLAEHRYAIVGAIDMLITGI